MFKESRQQNDNCHLHNGTTNNNSNWLNREWRLLVSRLVFLIMNEYIRLFKNIFEYHINGMLNNKEYCQLLDIIYYHRFAPEKMEGIKLSPKVELIWQALKPSMAKQKQNAKNYNEKKAKEAEENNSTQIVEKRSMNNEVDDNNLQLLLGLLEQMKPQTNQTFKMVKWNNKAISNFVDENRINEATQELAWRIYTSNN